MLLAPIHYIQKHLDSLTMYRTISLGLSILAAYALALSVFGNLPYNSFEILLSLTATLFVAFFTNWLASKIWRASVNYESAFITALIVFFLVLPAEQTSLSDTWIIAAVTALAIFSKFIFAFRKQHIVNPAAIGGVLLALVFMHPDMSYFETTWWIGQPDFFWLLLIIGVLIVMKLRKWTPVLAFLFVAFAVFLFEEWRFGSDLIAKAPAFWLSGPSLFLALFMLTEPFTMPPTKKYQFWYGAFVGLLSQTTIFVSLFKMTPELALVIGNIAFYPTTLQQKLIMPLIAIREVAKNTYEFVFQKPADLRFKAGQYLEWMLPHTGNDNRGIRRYFTIASAPSDEHIAMAVRFSDKVSTYKQALQKMKVGEPIIASQLAGDFTLPKDTKRRIACIAGGIGITPFLSQVREMQNTGEKRDYVLFYCNNTLAEVAYKDFFDTAQADEVLSVVHVLAKEQVAGMEQGFLDERILRQHTPDFIARDWYISGPPMVVTIFTNLLIKMGVPRSQITCDFFPGLA